MEPLVSKLPEVIERDYMRFRAQVIHDVGRVATPRFDALHRVRTDAKDDADLKALAVLLGLSVDALLNRKKLRERLRRFGGRLSVEKQAQLSALLGRWVREPDPAIIERWVEEQEQSIAKSIDTWLGRAAIALGAFALTQNVLGAVANQALTPEEARTGVARTTAALATRSRLAASAAVLALNSDLLSNVATSNGVGQYRWVTQDDERVRDNHAELHYSIQSWSDPPLGGGTKEDDEGHPGSGYGCRCIAEPLVFGG